MIARQILHYVTLLHDICQCYYTKTQIIFMNFAKAFDSVPFSSYLYLLYQLYQALEGRLKHHKHLLYKLEWYSIHGNVNNWISSFLNCGNQYVVLEGKFAPKCLVLLGHSSWRNIVEEVDCFHREYKVMSYPQQKVTSIWVKLSGPAERPKMT